MLQQFLNKRRSYPILYKNINFEDEFEDIPSTQWISVRQQPKSVYVPESHNLILEYDDGTTKIYYGGTQLGDLSFSNSQNRNVSKYKFEEIKSWHEFIDEYCKKTQNDFCKQEFSKLENEQNLTISANKLSNRKWFKDKSNMKSSDKLIVFIIILFISSCVLFAILKSQ